MLNVPKSASGSQGLASCHVTRQHYRKAPSLSSPEDEEIFLPKLPKSWHADVLKGPKVSTAIGAKRY